MGRIRVFGLGGHGREVAGVAQACGVEVEGFYDDAVAVGPTDAGYCFGPLDASAVPDVPVLVGVGDPKMRASIVARLAGIGCNFPAALVHPSAVLGPRVRLGRGVVIGSCSSITADVTVGDHTHLHSSVVVSHDCVLGESVTLAPRTALAGDVTVGRRTLIGVGATVNRGIPIGADVVVGAGAVVVHAVEDALTVAGVPARPLRTTP